MNQKTVSIRQTSTAEATGSIPATDHPSNRFHKTKEHGGENAGKEGR
jgi:hypothetical protein